MDDTYTINDLYGCVPCGFILIDRKLTEDENEKLQNIISSIVDKNITEFELAKLCSDDDEKVEFYPYGEWSDDPIYLAVIDFFESLKLNPIPLEDGNVGISVIDIAIKGGKWGPVDKKKDDS